MTDHEWDDWTGDDLDPDLSSPDLSSPGLPDLSDVTDLSDLSDVDTADLGGPDVDAPASPPSFVDSGVDSGADSPDGALDGALDGGAPSPVDELAATDDGAAVVGADPDLDPHADTTADPVFPPALEMEPPDPVDGMPWTDPATLGDAPLPDPSVDGAPEASELAAYAAEDLPPGTDPWTALAASDDPATSTLARWWHPPQP